MSEVAEPSAETDGVFLREANWETAIAVICDVMRGSSALAVETRVSAAEGDRRRSEVSKWSYEQTQPFRLAETSLPGLFTLEHLREVLIKMSDAAVFYAYEVGPLTKLGPATEGSLAEFTSITVSLVTLTVGDVVMSWVLVSLGQARDHILWKMKYHLRDDGF